MFAWLLAWLAMFTVCVCEFWVLLLIEVVVVVVVVVVVCLALVLFRSCFFLLASSSLFLFVSTSLCSLPLRCVLQQALQAHWVPAMTYGREVVAVHVGIVEVLERWRGLLGVRCGKGLGRQLALSQAQILDRLRQDLANVLGANRIGQQVFVTLNDEVLKTRRVQPEIKCGQGLAGRRALLLQVQTLEGL